METEVTNAQYAECVTRGPCTEPQNEQWNDPAVAQHPVVDVSWAQAQEYAAWVGGRLPTEAEWEKAARGTDGRTYPWGEDSPSANGRRVNFRADTLVPVGSYPTGASPYGLLDMSGNAAEWVADWYKQDYYGEAPARNPPGPAEEDSIRMKVIRGGFYTDVGNEPLRAAARGKHFPQRGKLTIGFRVLREAE